MIEFRDAKKAAGLLAAIGEQTRLQILFRLMEGPHNVGTLAEMLDVPIVNMSHHLGVMRQAGLIEDEKDGRRVIYRFRPDIFTPPDGDAESLGTLALGVCKLTLRKGSASIDGKARKKPKKAE